MQILAILLIGFSIFCDLLLSLSNIFHNQSNLQLASKLAGFLLLSSLMLIQCYHLLFLLDFAAIIPVKIYIGLLFLVAPSFYFYSRQILIINGNFRFFDLLHFLPIIPGMIVPYHFALPLAFLIGSGYLLWLARIVFSLRRQRLRFKFELITLAILFIIAIGVLILASVQPLIQEITFYTLYAILIGLAFFVAALTLLKFPAITAEVEEAVQANYVESTLKNIDRIEKISELQKLMAEDKLYTHEALNLKTLADHLDLNQHQLSELINDEFNKGFSRFIREYRINEAKKLLVNEPESSVLSIGLSVGFTSQSNFYAAFREITGMAPGIYRKNHT